MQPNSTEHHFYCKFSSARLSLWLPCPTNTHLLFNYRRTFYLPSNWIPGQSKAKPLTWKCSVGFVLSEKRWQAARVTRPFFVWSTNGQKCFALPIISVSNSIKRMSFYSWQVDKTYTAVLLPRPWFKIEFKFVFATQDYKREQIKIVLYTQHSPHWLFVCLFIYSYKLIV